MHTYLCISTLSIFINHSFAWWNISLCKLISVFMFLYFLSSIGPYFDQLLAIFIQFTFNFYILWVLPNFSLHIFLKKENYSCIQGIKPQLFSTWNKENNHKADWPDNRDCRCSSSPSREQIITFKLFSDAWLLGIQLFLKPLHSLANMSLFILLLSTKYASFLSGQMVSRLCSLIHIHRRKGSNPGHVWFLSDF